MRTSVKLQLLALSGFLSIHASAFAAPKELHNPEAAKYCPQEITNKQIDEFSAQKKLMINNHEFLVGPKFDKNAGQKYAALHKDGKVPATLKLKREKIKGEKAVCIYAYTYKAIAKRKEDAGKEIERKGRINIHTMIGEAKTKK